MKNWNKNYNSIQKIKHLAINLAKNTQNLYRENCRTLLRQIKDGIKEWIDIPC